MPWSRLRECGDAAGLQNASEFAQYILRIRSVMKGIEADDAIDARVRHVETAAITGEICIVISSQNCLGKVVLIGDPGTGRRVRGP